MTSSFTSDPALSGHQASEALGLWEPKRALTLEAARRHSARIRLFRRILIAMAAAMVLILGWQFATQQNTFIVDDNPGESVKMINPRYSGRTKDGLPYRLISESAIRLTQNAKEVALIKPVLQFMRAPGVKESLVVAATGQYDDVNQVLDLRSEVDLTTDDGYHCTSTHARVHANDKRIEGNEPIACDGSFGKVSGQSYEIKEDYSVFVFKDGTAAYLQPRRKEAQAEAPSESPFGFGGDGPIDVKAQTATYKGGLTVLEGDVDVKQADMQIYSNEMYLYREESEGPAQGSIRLGNISKIDARGDFKYITPDNTVSGNRGVYDQTTGMITVTGNVTATQPSGNTVRSERLTYDTRSKTIRFVDDCIEGDCTQRPSVRFNPRGN